MDPLKQGALLALALLQVVIVAKDLGCGSERTECRLISGSYESTVLECGGNRNHSNWSERVSRTTVTNIQTTNKTFLGLQQNPNDTDNGTKKITHQQNPTIVSLDNCNTNDTACESSSDVTLVSDDDKDIGNINITTKINDKLFKLSSYYNGSENEPADDRWLKSPSIEVHLLGNVSVLDLSFSLSAKTVIINTYGFDLLKVCGATNVSTLTVTSCPFMYFKIIGFFSNLKYLNLSHCNINTIPDTGISATISSLDLSFNNIALNKKYSLPKNLHTLNISYNNISNIEEVILKGNVIVLDIRGNKLLRVPAIEMDSLEELYLSNNDITALKEETFAGLSSLTILDLRANRLNELEEKVFQGLNRLQWLDLSENSLMSLAPATFQYLNNLVTLLLSKNVNLGNLQDIEDASLLFGTGQRLQEIEVSSTNLSKIPSTVTRSVRKLLLADNTISTIQCGEVDSFPLLQVIDVSNNMISEIEEDALGRLEFLSDLILAGNRLTNIPKSLPNQLQTLDLRCNRIRKLNNVDFLGLQKLRVLLLSRNNISVVEDGAFGQLINLDVLDLSYNPIKTLYRSSFTGPRRLKEVYLISLTDIIPLKEPLSFPAPESSHLEVLHLDSSPELATRLMDDVAALTMFHELYELSLRNCKQQTLRSDLPRYLPRLHKLDIAANPLNCTDVAWLIKWLQILNISVQDTGKIRHEIYSNRHRGCNNFLEDKRLDYVNAICATPGYLAGKSIISLKEDDFPDSVIKQLIPLSTEALITDLTTEIITQVIPGEKISKNPASKGDKLSTTTSMRGSLANVSHLNELVTVGYAKYITGSIVNNTMNHTGHLKSTEFKQFTNLKSETLLNKLRNVWKYSKNQSQYEQSTSQPLIVLLNDTKHTPRVIDNQINDSVSSGAFLAHEPPSTSHPGMMVFLIVIGVIIVASSAMVYSHCAQLRRSSQYHHHQDIEVSSLGGNELW